MPQSDEARAGAGAQPAGADAGGPATGRAMGPEPRPWRARLWTWLLGTAAFVLVGWALHATAAATTLVVFAVFLTLMLAPLVSWVKAHVPAKLSWLGEVAAAGVLLVIAVVFVGGLWIAAQQILGVFPDMGGQVEAVMGEEDGAAEDAGTALGTGSGEQPAATLAGLEDEGGDGETEDWAEGGLPLLDALPDLEALGLNLASRIGEVAGGAATAILNALTATITGAVIVFFLAILMLSEAGDWRARISRILDRPDRDEVFETAAVVGRQLRRYLVTRALMGVLTTALYVGWLWISGVDLLLVWALLTFLLGFIPNLGAVVSGLLPVIYALVAKDFATALLAGAGLLAIEQVVGNLIDPKISGHYVSVSPLVILISLLAWGWMWGVPGLLLAAPMTIAIMIVCAHVPALRPVALLMSNRRSMAEVDELASL